MRNILNMNIIQAETCQAGYAGGERSKAEYAFDSAWFGAAGG
jgi:hypothetical protein